MDGELSTNAGSSWYERAYSCAARLAIRREVGKPMTKQYLANVKQSERKRDQERQEAEARRKEEIAPKYVDFGPHMGLKLKWEANFEEHPTRFEVICPSRQSEVFRTTVYLNRTGDAWGIYVGLFGYSNIKGVWFGSAIAAMREAERLTEKAYRIGLGCFGEGRKEGRDGR